MEETFDSSNSTLTHCVNSAWKRKRDFESDCDSATSYFHSRMSLSMYERNLNELFQHLAYARLLQPPYDRYGGWEDTQLWVKIIEQAYKNDRFYQPSVMLIRIIALKYALKYAEDQLQDMEESSLKRNMCIVFNPCITPMDCLGVELLQDKQNMGNPSSSSKDRKVIQPPFQLKYKSDSSDSDCRVGYHFNNESLRAKKVREKWRAELLPTVPELGVKGGLAMQFGEDMAALKLSIEDEILFIPDYGPESPLYVSWTNRDAASRRYLLLSLLEKLKNNISQSSCRSSAKKNSRRPKSPAILDADSLFAELADARLFKGVYKDIPGDWANEHLWNAIRNSLPWPLDVPRPSKGKVLHLVEEHYDLYKVDPSLDWLPDSKFRNSFQTVFGDMSDGGPMHLNDRGALLVYKLSNGSESVNGMIQESWSSGGQQSVNGPQESFCESDLTE